MPASGELLEVHRLLSGLGLALALVAGLLTAGHAAASASRSAAAPAPASSVSSASSAAAIKPVAHQGYIGMPDGAQLEYTVDLPRRTGKFPVALVYDGYCEGAGPLACNDVGTGTALLNAGFAVLGVSLEGTSCSTGTFDAFTPQEWRDGRVVIEWAARQRWSTGHIGMIGDSFPGITQLGVAGLRPPHLDAIAPWQVTSDLYRDVAYPGGIVNVGFGAFWAGIDQPLNSYRSGVTQAAGAKDVRCLGALAKDGTDEPAHNVALEALLHPYYDKFWRDRTPGANASRIDVPALGCLAWQDDEVSSRAEAFYRRLDPRRTWVIETNGYHGMCELQADQAATELVAFFNRFVKGEHNGFGRTPHIQVWHEDHTNSAGKDVPSWVTGFRSYRSMPVRPLSLWFRTDGALALHRPTGTTKADTYLYPEPSLGNEDGDVAGQHNILWKAPEPPGGAVSYTTPRLTRDAEFYGSGSANIWLSSTAPDTDLQITLTEVRPDGHEVYITRGWLRASQRALNHKLSTRLAPYQTDLKSDVRSLVPGRPTLMRVQLRPFDYVFRKGSSVRLWIDTPSGLTGGWSLNFVNTPAINSVYADAMHPSALVLGHLRGGHAAAPLPRCDTLINEPCRSGAGRVPAGGMTIR